MNNLIIDIIIDRKQILESELESLAMSNNAEPAEEALIRSQIVLLEDIVQEIKML